MKYILTSFLLITILLKVNAQQLSSRQLDSLYYSVVKIRMPELLRNQIQTFAADPVRLKSATGLFNAVKLNIKHFNKQQRSILQGILDRPVTDTSFVTPGGFFRVHYNTSGRDTPTYNIQLFAQALDSVYNYEINYLGYPQPPSDFGAGGDNRYDVYITSTGGTYGYTVPDSEIIPGSGRYTAYTVIDNDFSGFYTTGINAARVTAAHEFAHAIHVGDYINRYFTGDEFFYELSATAMEHFVFSTIKDYLQYLPTYFNNTQTTIAANGTIEEFALGIWNIYQRDRFGFGIIKREWELMPKMRAMDAISTALQEYGSSLGSELNNFGIWMYYTNYRAIAGKYFEDASYYPLVKPIANLNFNSGLSLQLETGPSSNCFLMITNSALVDTLVTIFTNSDVEGAIDSSYSTYPFNFSIYDHQENNSTQINNNYFVGFSADKPAFWTTSEILNNSIVQSGYNIAGQLNYPFPSPFYYTKDTYLYIPINNSNDSYVQFNVYTVAMNLVYSTNKLVNYFNGEHVIQWNGRNNQNNKLSTGIYIYVTKTGGVKTMGKLAIINQ